MRPLPPDAAPERSVFDLDEHQQPEPPAQSSQLGEVVTSLDSITPVESHLQDTASLPAAPGVYTLSLYLSISYGFFFWWELLVRKTDFLYPVFLFLFLF